MFSEKILEEMPTLQPVALRAAQVYKRGTGVPSLTYKSKINLDVFLRTRHRSNLTLQNIVWKISTANIQMLIKGKRVLESLACNNREMLMAARDRYGGDINVTERLSEDRNEKDRSGKFAALFGEALFHNREIVEADGPHDEDFCIAFDNVSQEDIGQELGKRVCKAVMNKFSDTGAKRLKASIGIYKQSFKRRLRSVGPAKFSPIKLDPDPTKLPVRVKVRIYPML